MSDLLADDPEWADVVPLRQYENVNPIAPIFYSDECPYGLPVVYTCLQR